MSTASNGDYAEYIQQIIYLLNIAQRMCGQTCGVYERFRMAIATITEGQAQLIFHQNSSTKILPEVETSIGFPVQFGDVVYGTLYVKSNSGPLPLPALPLNVAQALAQICGWILYTFEYAALLPGNRQQTTCAVTRRITKCEQEILLLIGQGHSRKAIAQKLSISLATLSKHLQNIYKKLDVHCERDALLAAYATGLYSPLIETHL